MNKLEKMRLFLASCMMGMAVSIVSCSSENGENDILDGKGTIRCNSTTFPFFGKAEYSIKGLAGSKSLLFGKLAINPPAVLGTLPAIACGLFPS